MPLEYSTSRVAHEGGRFWVIGSFHSFLAYCLDGGGGGGGVGGLFGSATTLLSFSKRPGPPRAMLIWCTVLQRWLLMAVTLDKLSFADGMVLARTCKPTVRRQPELAFGVPSSGGGAGCPSTVEPRMGTMENPMGRRGMQEGSSPLIAN